MKQLVQNYRTGELKLEEVPAPMVRPGGVLVRTVNSVVSVGTEKLMMEFARKSLLGKARARPDLAKQVIDLARTEGPMRAYELAINRLDMPVPLGYSSSGTVLEVGRGVGEFTVGDRVACSRGSFASHAEIVFVPRNLCVQVPENVDFESAAFATVGAISLHALRLAELTIGERVAIIGLGLLGQLAVQIAKASGLSVFGSDPDLYKLTLARQQGVDEVSRAEKDEVIGRARAFTQGDGFDAVIILASAASNEPLEIAAEICREKGKIVVPGMVKLDIPRDVFYRKELSLVVSRGGGPGFDDPEFETRGIDYPRAYVRWTERTNMAQFLDLVSRGKVQVHPLITHRFRIEEAERAYESLNRGMLDKYVGILLTYDATPRPLVRRIELKKAEGARPGEKVSIGLIGAGTFAASTMLPILRKMGGVRLKGVATATGPTGKRAGERFGFEYCTTDYTELLKDPEIDGILIATRHDLHARFAAEGLSHGKDVFVEKPLALTLDQLKEVVAAYAKNPGRLMVGFNRRFSPFALMAKRLLAPINEPLVIHYRVNAGFIARDSWVHDPNQGGGRILGEICHFVDFAQFLTDSPPLKVYAESLRGTGVYAPDENVAVTVSFANGSVASITYVANGDKAFPRERVEVFGGGGVCVIDNFKSLLFSRGGGKRKARRFNKDIGHRNEFAAFFDAIRKGEPCPMRMEEIIYTTLATFAIEESLARGAPVTVDLKDLEIELPLS